MNTEYYNLYNFIDSKNSIGLIHKTVDLKHNSNFEKIRTKTQIKDKLKNDFKVAICVSDMDIYLLFPKETGGRLSRSKKIYNLYKIGKSNEIESEKYETSLTKTLKHLPNKNSSYYIQSGSSIRYRDDDSYDINNDVFYDFRTHVSNRKSYVIKFIENKIKKVKSKLMDVSGKELQSLANYIVKLEDIKDNYGNRVAFDDESIIRFLRDSGYDGYFQSFGLYASIGSSIKSILNKNNITMDQLSKKYIDWYIKNYI